MIVLSFNRVFSESEQNPNLADDLIANELQAIVSWFVAGALRSQVQGGYTIPESHQAELDKWRKESDPVRAFAEERLTHVDDDKAMLPSRIIYATYRAWCAENGYRALATNRFGERMKLLQMCPKHTMNGSFYPVGLRP
jgi:phage/plasmid-associated DNA primase